MQNEQQPASQGLGDKTYTVYIGSYADEMEPGIHVYTLDAKTGRMTLQSSTSGILNPSFLTVDKQHHRLFAVSEALETPGHLASYTIDPNTHTLSQLDSTSTLGAAPCYVDLSEGGDLAVVANYTGGNLSLFSVSDTGSLTRLQTISHSGSSVNRDRQEAPHPHSTVINRGETGAVFVYVQDLGIDNIITYRLDKERQKLRYHGEVQLESGAGPRHLVFHRTHDYAYVINELDATVTAFAADSAGGGLSPIQTVSTLPDDEKVTNLAADIHMSQDGKYLYASNRGHDSIVVFEVDLSSGRLTLRGTVSTGGSYPRNFAITPDGRWMLVANQNTDNIVTYQLNPFTGMPEPTGYVIGVPRPVCVQCVDWA